MIAFAAAATAAVVCGAMWLLVRPPARLERRVRPYLGRTWSGEVWSPTTRRSFGRVAIGAAAERLGSAVDGLAREALEERLRQAAMFQDADDPAGAYRVRQLGDVGAGVLGSSLTGGMLGMEPRQIGVLALLGLVVGLTRQRGRIGRAIEDRRRRMVVEIYTVNQILAIRVRAGGGVIQAVTHMVRRGSGEVVGELAEALRLHRAGISASAAFRRVADASPEPACARTYAFLALAEERGVDLGDALLSLASDVREARREAIRRTATRRRAAMLVPTIAVLAPVMLLFIGAPLPSLVLGFT